MTDKLLSEEMQEHIEAAIADLEKSLIMKVHAAAAEASAQKHIDHLFGGHWLSSDKTKVLHVFDNHEGYELIPIDDPTEEDEDDGE